jgi:hypothetical protein
VNICVKLVEIWIAMQSLIDSLSKAGTCIRFNLFYCL